jgi:hypothetical protein
MFFREVKLRGVVGDLGRAGGGFCYGAARASTRTRVPGTPPMYGDYEAQRHWMEITTNLAVTEWYKDTTNNNLTYWGLDYPPLTAYHMYLCGAVAQRINHNYTKLHESRGFESDAHKLFMRYTVLVADVAIYIPALIAYFYTTGGAVEGHKVKPLSPSLSTILALLYPGIILIDHGHFQYNCVSLGLAVFATVFILRKRNIAASVCFCAALNYKQMELYHALPFFMYLLSCCVPKPGQTTLSSLVKTVKNRSDCRDVISPNLGAVFVQSRRFLERVASTVPNSSRRLRGQSLEFLVRLEHRLQTENAIHQLRDDEKSACSPPSPWSFPQASTCFCAPAPRSLSWL